MGRGAVGLIFLVLGDVNAAPAPGKAVGADGGVVVTVSGIAGTRGWVCEFAAFDFEIGFLLWC